MLKEMTKQMLRERKAGFEAFHRIEVEIERERSVADRMADLNYIVHAARVLGMRTDDTVMTDTWKRWERLRKAHELQHHPTI